MVYENCGGTLRPVTMWYIHGTPPIKQPFGVYESRVDIMYGDLPFIANKLKEKVSYRSKVSDEFITKNVGTARARCPIKNMVGWTV